MKNLRSVLFALTVLLMATAAQAQSTTNVKANVPFDFVVGDHAYPAGEYSLESMSNGIAIRIDDREQAATGIALSRACSGSAPANSTKLVFHRVGDNYFLYQIWTEGNLSGREFSKSRAEVQLAQNHEKPGLVIVAANISH
jgi:hypothetical protein